MVRIRGRLFPGSGTSTNPGSLSSVKQVWSGIDGRAHGVYRLRVITISDSVMLPDTLNDAFQSLGIEYAVMGIGAAIDRLERFDSGIDIVFIIEPLSDMSILDACAAIGDIPGGHSSRIVAVAQGRDADMRDLMLAGADAVLASGFDTVEIELQAIAAVRMKSIRTPLHETAHCVGPEDSIGDRLVAGEVDPDVNEPEAAELSLPQAMIEHLYEAIMLLDADGSVKITNRALCRLSGFDHNGLSDASIFTLFPPHIAGALREKIGRRIHGDNGNRAPMLVDLIRRDGHVTQVTLSLYSIPATDSGRPYIQAVLREVAREERTRQELQAIQEVIRIIASEKDLNSALKRVLQTLEQRRGYARGSIWTLNGDGLALSLRAALSDDVPPWMPTDRGIIGRVVRSRQPVFLPDVAADSEYIAISPVVVSEICVPILHEDRLIGVIDMESDAFRPLEESDLDFLELLSTQVAGLIERAELQADLEWRATTDPITGLPNRQVFKQPLDAAISNAHGDPVSALILGVDGFKSTNDLYGHTVADDILQQIGRVLKARISADHLLARHTSDQFAVLLPGVERDDAVTIAENLRIGVAMQLFTAAEQVEQLGVSIGAATFPDDAGTAQGLLQAADHAMYLAKRAGRNQTFQSNAAFAVLASSHGRINDLLRQAPKETLALLVRAMDQCIPERAGHSERVTRYALAIARQMGLPEEDMARLRTAAYIHDIGMMSLPDALLHKPMSLSPDERQLLRSVPVAARGLLSQLDLPESVLTAVVHLRESWDGSGYPGGLAGENIPIGARVIAVADAIDALTSPRAHRAPITIEQALEQVRRQAGHQFDPAVARASSVITDVIRSPFTPDDPSVILTDVDRVHPSYPELPFEG